MKGHVIRVSNTGRITIQFGEVGYKEKEKEKERERVGKARKAITVNHQSYTYTSDYACNTCTYYINSVVCPIKMVSSRYTQCHHRSKRQSHLLYKVSYMYILRDDGLSYVYIR